jgi:urea transporter
MGSSIGRCGDKRIKMLQSLYRGNYSVYCTGRTIAGVVDWKVAVIASSKAGAITIRFNRQQL